MDRSHSAIEGSGLRYSKLRHPDSIRILELLPAASMDSPLTGKLKLSRLEDSAYDYEALSYVWGDVSNTVDLCCEGRVMGITQNLDAALRHVRCTDRPRYLWVDAICIDQSNTAERGHQVRLMRSIYKIARQVLIWIGEDEPYRFEGIHRSILKPGLDTTTKAAHAFEILSHVYDMMNVKWAITILERRKESRQDWMDWEHDLSVDRQRWKSDAVYNDTWEVVEEFFSSPWFGRQCRSISVCRLHVNHADSLPPNRDHTGSRSCNIGDRVVGSSPDCMDESWRGVSLA